MSLLLDALRQAEKAKAQVKPPEIESQPPADEPRKQQAGLVTESDKVPAFFSLETEPTENGFLEIELLPAFDLMPSYTEEIPEISVAVDSEHTASEINVSPPSSAKPEDVPKQIHAETTFSDSADQENPVQPVRLDIVEPKLPPADNSTPVEAQAKPTEEVEAATRANSRVKQSVSPDGIGLAENVLDVANGKPPKSGLAIILVVALIGLLGAGAYLYQIAFPTLPVYTDTVTEVQEQDSDLDASPTVPDSELSAQPTPLVDSGTASAQIQPQPASLFQPSGSVDMSAPKANAEVLSKPGQEPEASNFRQNVENGGEDFVVETPDPIVIKVRRQPIEAELNLNRAYNLYQQQDYLGASGYYQQVLQDAPSNLDALLGMAAVMEQFKDMAKAKLFYQKVLTLDHTNSYAHNGLIRLEQTEQPVDKESHYRELLHINPGSAEAHAALGALYAEQARWNDAQQAYFDAATNAPENPEYQFNLAVSLDHLGKKASARRYYQQALDLSQGVAVGFDSASIYLRLQQLAE